MITLLKKYSMINLNFKLLIFAFLFWISINAYSQVGKASFYHDKFQGRTTANGEKFDQGKLTCASKSYKFGSIIKVTNLKNNKHVICRVNDRGPFVKGRVIDLSKSAFKAIGDLDKGVIKVILEKIK